MKNKINLNTDEKKPYRFSVGFFMPEPLRAFSQRCTQQTAVSGVLIKRRYYAYYQTMA
jgi:hypothetical protein